MLACKWVGQSRARPLARSGLFGGGGGGPIGCGAVNFLLLMSYLLVGEAGLEGRAMAQRLVPSHGWVELGSGPFGAGPCPEVSVGTGGIKAACLLVGGTMSPPI